MRALPVAALALLGPLADTSVRWAPAVGEEVEWRWRVETVLELERGGLRVQTLDGGALLSGLEDARFELRDELELHARDIVHERVEPGPVSTSRELTRARRRTSSIGDLHFVSSEPDELVLVSPLEGVELELEADGSSGDPVARFADGQGRRLDACWLEGLDAELDLRSLLDGGVRSQGDRWYPGDEAAARLLRPGGELHLVPSEDGYDGEHDLATVGWLLGASLVAAEASAWARAEYEGVEETEAGPRALVRLRIDIEAEGDVRDRLAVLEETLGWGSTWLESAEELLVEHELRLEGLLRWDLEADRAASLELSGAIESELEIRSPPELWGGYRILVDMHGEMTVTVEAREPER